MTNYETIVGLEVHVHLATRSKMFCGCEATLFSRHQGGQLQSAEPNTHICPVCTGMPGVLPVINRQAVEYAIMAGLALNCQIADFTRWDRKNYHYPDLPKGYQISQYDLPLSANGWLTVDVDGQEKRIRIRRAHLEEDAGKLIHRGDHSLVDLNRAGLPLLEIVTEPDIRSADEAYAFLTKLQSILRYLGVSTADMEKGAMRCEPNISLRPLGSTEFGTLTEIKNLNSFRAVRDSLAYEVKRQTAVLESGREVLRETRGWVEERQVTVSQRSKEGAEDYRYFPEPDLPPLLVSEDWLDAIRARLPELPDARKSRFIVDYGLTAYDAGVLTADRAVADFFEAAVDAYGGNPKSISNWISGELFRLMKEDGVDLDALQVSPAGVAELASLVDKGSINTKTAREVLREMVRTGTSAAAIVERRGLAQISDQTALEGIVARVLADNPEQVTSYLEGKESLVQWLMGQVMRETRGKANPKMVLALLAGQLDSMRNNG
jgi:aspartyl-tRNA(Asn)/glutamyl-tRNA(Gln) amidotransferase subunit B